MQNDNKFEKKCYAIIPSGKLYQPVIEAIKSISKEVVI
jgi:hypothetical protein